MEILGKWAHCVVEWSVWRQQAALRWKTYPKGCQCDDYFSASRRWGRRADHELKSNLGAAEGISRVLQSSSRTRRSRPGGFKRLFDGRWPARGAT